MFRINSTQPLEIQVTRGNYPESVHFVDIVVLDAEGKMVQSYGDPEKLYFSRSAIKPIQAMSLVLSGAVKKKSLTEKEICLACASHLGERIHTDCVSAWMSKVGLKESDLVCGAHDPFAPERYKEMIKAEEKPTKFHNNCSGKHTGMLTTCLQLGFKTAFYERYDHPLQIRLREQLSRYMGVDFSKAPWGIDGCGIPTYATPLKSFAEGMRLFLRTDLSSEEKDSAKVILKSIFAEPDYISGSQGFCSDVIRTSGDQVMVKVGAEGVYCGIALSSGISFALKSRDGVFRSVEAALLYLLGTSKSLSVAQIQQIQNKHTPLIRNWAGLEVGKVLVKAPESH
ncbi:MAG: asparaginase [Pseudobdellovibrionaceae bacterium]|jgi:L-asparaginase II